MKNWFKNGLHEAWRYWNPENTNSNNANHESSRDVSKYSINDSVDLQHSVITSALWALARSPALVSAVEFEETRDGSTQQLSKILRDLGRDDVLNNVMKLKDAMGDAEAYLAASNIPRFWRMEPLEAMRAIVGVCADSKAVMDTATKSVYHEETRCTNHRCSFTGGERRTELELRCRHGSAQLLVESRAHPNTSTMCSVCGKKTLRKAWTMQVAPDCLVVTWPLLAHQGEIPKEILRVRKGKLSTDVFTFKLGVMVAHKTRHMCLFRNGNNFYMATGQEVKEVRSKDWLNAIPLMALYFHDPSGDSPATTPRQSMIDSVGNGKQGKAIDWRRGSSILPSPSISRKRRRSETEWWAGSWYGAGADKYGGDRGSHSSGYGSGASYSIADSLRQAKQPAAMTLDEAQEVIEVDDDDDDYVVNNTTAPPSPADGSRAVQIDRHLDDYNRADGETTARYHGEGVAGAAAARRGGDTEMKDNDGDDRGLPRKTSVDTTAAVAPGGDLACLISTPGAGASKRHFHRVEQWQRPVVDDRKRTERSITPTVPPQSGATGLDSGRSISPPPDNMDVDEERADEKSTGADTGHRRSVAKRKTHPPSPSLLSSQHELVRDGVGERSSDFRASGCVESRDGNNRRKDASTSASVSRLAAGERSEVQNSGDSQMRRLQQRERENHQSRSGDVTMIVDSGSEDGDVRLLASEETSKGAPADLSWKGGSGPETLRRDSGSSGETEKIAGDRMVVAACTTAVTSRTFVNNMSRSPPPQTRDSETSTPLETGLDNLDDDDEASAGEKAALRKNAGLPYLDKPFDPPVANGPAASQRPAFPEASTGPQNASEVQGVDGSFTTLAAASVLPSWWVSHSRPVRGCLFSTSKVEGEGAKTFLPRPRQRETNKQQFRARHSTDLKDRHGTAHGRRGSGSGRGGASGEAGGWGGGTGGRQKTMLNTWTASNSSAGTVSAVANTISVPKSLHSIASNYASSDGEGEEEWKPSASPDSRRGATSDSETWDAAANASRRRTRSSYASSNSKAITDLAGGTAVGSGCGAGLLEVLTVPDASQEVCFDDGDVFARDGGCPSSRSKGASHGSESEALSGTVDGDSSNGSVVVRGITLKTDDFTRILVQNGWLTSQIIDVRVKQLQEMHPQNLYFDSSFFGFLCPTTEKGGGFVVDNARVEGWTKRSRLPGGKESLFDMKKLFIPINQGNVHWVLVVVDLDGGEKVGDGGGGVGEDGRGRREGEGHEDKVVWFLDSFGRDGTPYVQAVLVYLVKEASRSNVLNMKFVTRPRPPPNAPRQYNSSDCGILMLHVMEKLSEGSVDQLVNLSQREIWNVRQDLILQISEC